MSLDLIFGFLAGIVFMGIMVAIAWFLLNLPARPEPLSELRGPTYGYRITALDSDGQPTDLDPATTPAVQMVPVRFPVVTGATGYRMGGRFYDQDGNEVDGG